MNRNRYKALFGLRLKRSKFEFDSQIYSIKRNLLIFSSIIIASTFVSPNVKGVYEINMGIIKGDLKTPELLYLFLGIVCLYYLIWLILHARKLVVDNYTNLNNTFMWQLSSLYAKDKFQEIAKKSTENWSGIPDFMGRSASSRSWHSYAEISEHALRNYPQFRAALIQSDEIRTTAKANGIEMLFEFIPEKDDYLFFKIHRDFCWASRLDEWFVTLFPIIYAVSAEILLLYHVLFRLQ